MLKSEDLTYTKRILPLIFLSLFSINSYSEPIDLEKSESITPEQERLLQGLPADQAAAVRLKIMDQQTLTNEIKKTFEDVNTLVLRPEKRELTGQEKIEYEKKARNWVYGYELFASAPSTFAAATDIPIPNDYLIGPGDTFMIQVLGGGNSTGGGRQQEYIVDRSYSITLPGIKPFNLAGLSFNESRELIQKQVKTQFVGSEAIVSLGGIRSIKVFVMGSAYLPGAYTVSSLASITNVLHISGGVSDIGSVRNIELKRKGKLITTFDLYDLLLEGDTSSDIRVQNGDVIFIPTIRKSARMHGDFRRPGLFELKEGENLKTLIDFAGGFGSNARANAGELNRVNRNIGNREIIKINANLDENLNLKVLDGDMFFVPSITALSQANVILSGQFRYPGSYSVKNGEKLSSLLERAGGFTESAFIAGAVLNRESISEMQNTSFRRAADDMESAIAGAIIGGKLQGGVGAATSDLITRLRTVRSPGRLIVDIDPINIEKNPEKDIYIEDGDKIHIPSRVNAVTVVGDVYSPGTIPFKNSHTTKDYLAQAGGLRPSADPKEIFMILPNGEARAVRDGIWKLRKQFISPGTTLYIPRDTSPFDWLLATKTVTPILSNLATTAAALAAIDD
tara:strand:- start:1239 stop:3107 length:1869 start_codon:yes stop_codon:yes gene_type:complete